MLKETDGEMRRLGAYHTGIETKVGGVRMPVWKHEAANAVFAKLGLTFSEGVERLIDTQLIRDR